MRSFTVAPSIPAPLAPLKDIAQNLRWCWHADTASLFQRLDAELWEETRHNPFRMLSKVKQKTLDRAAQDPGFLDHLERVKESLARYLARPPYAAAGGTTLRTAYFCAEIALTESLPIYSGGLGILAGDHLKSASDLGIPLCGVTLYYHEGFTVQKLSSDGWQQDLYPYLDPSTLAMELLRDRDGKPHEVSVDLPDGRCLIRAWRVQVGRVPLYLLDTNVPQNQETHRQITARLYGGDREMRIRQEVVLGVGGVRMLEAIGEPINVFHLNEGHAAFLGIERVRAQMTKGLSFAEARELGATTSLFTTHTPVRAGNDEFEPGLMMRYFAQAESRAWLSMDEFLALGRDLGAKGDAPFNMTILALRLCHSRNGVSRLHGQVSRRKWNAVWPGIPEGEVPIGSITNGVHFPSWVHKEVGALYDTYLGFKWRDDPEDFKVWENVQRIPNGELWRSRERRREELVTWVRQKTGERVLDPDALTIGFARRFAPYKRADLILRDLDRLERIVNHADRPVQILFAGKAHPNNHEGKEIMRRVFQITRQERFRRRIVFVEEYDLELGRRLTQGVDLWLNTPRKPLEASGTSGMKAVLNGVLHLSSDDGWWAEADREGCGWTIGGTDELDPGSVDAAEASILYDLVEKEVTPAFYDRGHDGLPARWIAMMKASIARLCPVFNTHRMVREYAARYYVPAAQRAARLGGHQYAGLRNLVAWVAGLHQRFADLQVQAVEESLPQEGLTVGGSLTVRARILFGRMTSEEVEVQLYTGRMSPDGIMREGSTHPMQVAHTESNGGPLTYEGRIPLTSSGQHGYAVRILPRHSDLGDLFSTGKMLWS